MRFLEHDRVVKYLGNAVEHGIVVKALNRLTREYFPIVWIVDGPRKDTREYTSKGWRPVIDWEPHIKRRLRGVEHGIAGAFEIVGTWGKQSRVDLPPDLKKQFTKTDPKGRFTLEITRL